MQLVSYNMLLKVVCSTNAFLAMHSNTIEELQKFHELRITKSEITLTDVLYNYLVNSK